MTETRIDGRKLRYQHRRPELLAAATEYVLDHGVSELSLRPMATALGVSHATLIRHFETKEALIAEVLERIRVDFESRLLSEALSETSNGADLLRAVWNRLCQPREQRQFRVLFELAAAAGYSGTRDTALPDALIRNWIDLTKESLLRYGFAPETAAAAATFVVAQIRGLQIDLITTGERARVDQAFELMITMASQLGLDVDPT
ncbi:TetR/AcrR family transcriptional regulator [Nocardia sp. CDC159]|uniref:TetR/AcrR family transcriptional regulator n=1 Tax=Nocardia pulmonis TaxID=2951408 RepID=A0A9X2E2U7_9NOCA|nr:MULTISPECIES: TetR/AcrR family transcriptional regulator [Nocardia]MCM6773117.1 TetR/AcrR family transcriptional regulator [Nocardia pulmonis]MCM6785580.1 TetR/AcrR family transcriptional regulator [Nocardia sp. CDC159]